MEHSTIVEACARAAHEANKVYCDATGDLSQKPWEQAEEWQRSSARAGVQCALEGATPDQQHEAWCRDKLAAGWMYGGVKDADAKTHPCLVPYAKLPKQQQLKDSIYIAVVTAMAHALGSGATAP